MNIRIEGSLPGGQSSDVVLTNYRGDETLIVCRSHEDAVQFASRFIELVHAYTWETCTSERMGQHVTRQ
jgi:hypothetical protein